MIARILTGALLALAILLTALAGLFADPALRPLDLPPFPFLVDGAWR